MKRTVFALLLTLILSGFISPRLYAQEESDEQALSGGRYGSDSVTCIMNISLYREFFKQWRASDYKNATIHDVIGPWRWVFLNCPKGTQNTYIDGVKIVSWMIETAKDPSLKEKYIDTLMMVYDQRIVYFGKVGYVLGRKGVDLATFRPTATENIYNDLKKSVDLEGNSSAGPVLIYYMKAAVNMAVQGKADTAVIFDAYDACSRIVEANLKSASAKGDWETIQNNLELILEPFATCPDLVKIFRAKFHATPDDIELLKKITKNLDDKDCHDDPLYFEATKKLYELEPSPASAYLIGKMLLNEAKYSEAIEYLKEADKLEDPKISEKSYMYIAQSYRALNNLPMARSYALKATEINPSNGDAYLLIGDLYAESAKNCGDNELTSRVAFWAAVDKYQKAKQVDPSKAEEADKRIATYSMYFPPIATIFFYTLKEGDTYRVECWINEDTKVRASKQ